MESWGGLWVGGHHRMSIFSGDISLIKQSSAVLKVFGGLVDLKMTFCIKVDNFN